MAPDGPTRAIARILVAEPSPAMRSDLARCGGDGDLAFETVADGAELLLRLRGRVPPSVVLLDLALPGLDAWELLHQLQVDPLLAGVAVILVGDPPRPLLPSRIPFLPRPLDGDRLVQQLRICAACQTRCTCVLA